MIVSSKPLYCVISEPSRLKFELVTTSYTPIFHLILLICYEFVFLAVFNIPIIIHCFTVIV